MIKVFIDGREGTTGLQIYDRLAKRSDVELITLPEELRKNTEARKQAIHSADAVFLCLPDAAATEAAILAEGSKAKIIDASTAHRTAEGWAYGFAELSKAHRERIASSYRIANPGCYASGFISLVYPLVKSGIAGGNYSFVCHAVSGFSGAGKKGIAMYESENRDIRLDSPRLYALSLSHKHIPEMMKECSLSVKPIFNPYVCDYYCGMQVNVPLFADMLNKRVTPSDLYNFFSEFYSDSNFIKVIRGEDTDGFISSNDLSGSNNMQIIVSGNEDQILLTSRFDNLGKGASGAAVQNMNIAFGLDETTSLI